MGRQFVVRIVAAAHDHQNRAIIEFADGRFDEATGGAFRIAHDSLRAGPVQSAIVAPPSHQQQTIGIRVTRPRIVIGSVRAHGCALHGDEDHAI